MQTTARVFTVSACLLLLTGVQLGALGAHALTNILTPAQINSWELAVLYQMVHSLGLKWPEEAYVDDEDSWDDDEEEKS